MRLTLRTMLAYMDGILDPADAADVGTKIEASPYATKLMEKTRDVIKRLRLAAPKLEGRGMGLDSNTVAEYLDNTLPSERVADFEKVCLESDIHLAEVASCHQILALVLGEPAEVDSRARQRMYSLLNKPQTASAPAAEPAAAAAPAAHAEETPLMARKKLEVPDYLLEAAAEPKRGSLMGMLLAIAVVALLGATVGGLLAYPELLQQLAGPQTVAETPAEPADAPLVAQGETAPPAPADGITAEPAAPAPADAPATTDGSSPPDAALAQPPVTVDGPRPGDAAPGAVPEPSAVPAVPPTDPTARPALPDLPPATEPPAATPPATPMPPATDAPGSSPQPPLPNDTPLPQPPATPPVGTGPAVTDTTPPAGPPQPVAEGVARKIVDPNVLLRFDTATNAWTRFVERAPLMAGDTLLALPGFRSKLVVASGITIDALGGTLFMLDAPDARGVPGIQIERGRLILASAGAPNAPIRIKVGTAHGTLTLVNADATVAIDVRRRRAEGTDPEKQAADATVEVYITGGQIGWTVGAEPTVMISGPAYRQLLPTGELHGDAAVALNFPEWITIDDRSPLDRNTADLVGQNLKVDRSVTLSLKELAGDRKTEVSLLALRCLAELGEFDDFVSPLRDAAQRGNWKPLLDTLFVAIDYGPDTAKRVRAAFERHGTRGSEMYRMLWGYSNEQLNQGAAGMLVDNLDHAELDMRVVAFWTLQRITGLSLFYQPHDTDARRRPNTQKWRQRLEAGQIVHREAT